MFAAQPAVSGYCLHNFPSSRCLQTSANSAGLKGCRGRAQLIGLPTLLHFHAKPVQRDFVFIFSLFSFLPPFFLQHRGEVSDNLTGVFTCSLFRHSFSCQPFLSTYMTKKLHCLVATSSMYLHSFGCGLQTPAVITALCRSAMKRMVSDSLSACSKLGLDLCSLRCGGTAFNALMIKGEIILNSVQPGRMNWSRLWKEWPDPYFSPKLRLLFDPQCALWFWYHRRRRERKQQAES